MNHIRYSLSFELFPGAACNAACSHSCLSIKSQYTHQLRYPEIHSPVNGESATHNKNNKMIDNIFNFQF